MKWQGVAERKSVGPRAGEGVGKKAPENFPFKVFPQLRRRSLIHLAFSSIHENGAMAAF